MKFSVILFEGKLFRVRVPILRWGHGSLKFWASLDASEGSHAPKSSDLCLPLSIPSYEI